MTRQHMDYSFRTLVYVLLRISARTASRRLRTPPLLHLGGIERRRSGLMQSGLPRLRRLRCLPRADPRSIRYNSQIGVVNVANSPCVYAGGHSRIDLAEPIRNATANDPIRISHPDTNCESQPVTLGDNTVLVTGLIRITKLTDSNSHTRGTNFSVGDTWRPVMMNRPFRSVGEMGYAFRDQPFRTLSFSSTNSPGRGSARSFHNERLQRYVWDARWGY